MENKNLNGTIEAVSIKDYRGTSMYSMKIGNDWYGCGKVNPGAKGDSVSFDSGTNAKGYLEATNIRKVEGAPARTGVATNGGGGDGSVTNDNKIAWQAARNSAHALLAVAVSNGLPGSPESYAGLVAESNKLTLSFYNSTQTPGAVGQVAAQAARRREPEQDEFNDEVPY